MNENTSRRLNWDYRWKLFIFIPYACDLPVFGEFTFQLIDLLDNRLLLPSERVELVQDLLLLLCLSRHGCKNLIYTKYHQRSKKITDVKSAINDVAPNRDASRFKKCKHWDNWVLKKMSKR